MQLRYIIAFIALCAVLQLSACTFVAVTVIDSVVETDAELNLETCPKGQAS